MDISPSTAFINFHLSLLKFNIQWFHEINFRKLRCFEIFVQIVRKCFSFLSRNHLEFWRRRDSTLTNEFHRWYMSTPKPCNGVDFSEATCTLYFSPHSRETLPAAWPFFVPKTPGSLWGLTPDQLANGCHLIQPYARLSIIKFGI